MVLVHFGLVVALGACPRVVIAGGVTVSARARAAVVTRECVIEVRVLPVGRVFVAIAARAGEVAGRRGVATRAVRASDLAVVEGRVLPVGGVLVAGAARPAEMGLRRAAGVAGRAVLAAHLAVVEPRVLPVGR